VKNGKARFIGADVIEFFDSSERQRIALQCEQRLQARLTGGGYDGIDRVLDASELRRIVVNPDKLIRREKSSRDWSYSTAVLRNSTAEANGGDPYRYPESRGRGGEIPAGEGPA
jgi:hypothetical protein